MRKPIGLGLAAVIATTSIAMAGGRGEDDKKKAEEARKNADAKMLERLAASPTKAQDVEVTAAPGTGITFEVGDEFSLRLNNWVQVLYRYSALDDREPVVGGVSSQDTSNFSIRRARTDFTGHVFDPRKTFKVMLDWSQDIPGISTIQDAWFNWDFFESEDGMSNIGVRLGQQKPHFGREFQGSGAFLEHTERSLASRIFSGFRVIGAWLHGTHMEGQKLHWWAGVGNSDPARASTALESGQGANNTDNEMNWFFDVRFDPFGNVGDEYYVQGDLDYHEEARGTVGASFMYGNEQPSGAASALTNGDDVETFSLNFYTAWHYQGLSALAEIFLREDESDFGDVDSAQKGYAVSVGYVMQPSEEGGPQWGFAARWSMFNQDDVPLLLVNTPLGTVGGLGLTGDVDEVSGTVTNYYRNAFKEESGRLSKVFDSKFVDHSPDPGQVPDLGGFLRSLRGFQSAASRDHTASRIS